MKISINNLSKQFGGKSVLNDINCQIGAGELIAVLGTNGAGKTTLLKSLATLYFPSGGHILLDGERLDRSRLELRARLHFLSDNPFFLKQTAVEHICMACSLYDRSLAKMKPKIIDMLKQFDLIDLAERPVRELSRGQKYKAAFAALAAISPELWLLDEPFGAGVDPPGLAVMKRMISKAVGQGATVIYTTQILELAESFSDRVMVLHEGRLRADMETSQLNSPDSPNQIARLFENLRVGK